MPTRGFKMYNKLHKNSIFFILHFLLVLDFSNTVAQKSQVKFDKIDLSDGLSQSSITSIIQDDKGFIWFGTLDGLNKYDGYQINVFRHNSKEAYSIPENAINVLYQSSEKDIWIGMKTKGVCKYNIISDRFYLMNDKAPTNLNVTAIIEDENGDIWIGTNKGLFEIVSDDPILIQSKLSQFYINDLASYEMDLWLATNSGLWKYDTNKNAYDQIDISFSRSDNNFEINTLFIDSNGLLWIGTKSGLIKYDMTTGFKADYYNESGNSLSLSSDNISSFAEDNDGNIWIGTIKGGLNKYNENLDSFESYMHNPIEPKSLSVNDILSLYVDKTNILWIGTSLGGINRRNPANEDFKIYRNNAFDKYSLSSNQVRAIYKDKHGTFWIGTVDGGLNKWDRNTNKFTHFLFQEDNPHSLSHNYVRTIYEDYTGSFWIGTDGGGINLFDREEKKFYHYKKSTFASKEKNPSSDRIWKIYGDKNGFLWIATFGGGLNKFDPQTGVFKHFRSKENDPGSISSDLITTVYEDHQGKIWIGTYGGGLNRYKKKDNSFTIYKSGIGSNSIGSDYIYCITEDSEKNLWIGAKGSLNKFYRGNTTFKVFTENEGLPNDVVMGILEDNIGYLWLSTNKGLVKFDPMREIVVRSYDVDDGLQSNEFLVGSYLKADNGELFFGGINGFNSFFPDDIQENPYPPEVVITNFEILNQPVDFDTNITEKKRINLTYKDYSFTFGFVALDYSFPEKNQYRYKMEGFDKDWIYNGTRRFASYTNLPPGQHYTFRVKGSNNDDLWCTQPASIEIYIKPAFWQTNWFKIAVAGFFIILAFIIIRLRIKRIERQKAELERLVKKRTAEIVQQKEEIEAQRDEIEAQRDDLQVQRDLANEQREKIQLQNKEIMDSIFYAKRIQNAILPQIDYLDSFFSEFFVLFKPRNIVSGDFYWATHKNNQLFIAAADCTGHGVPGAFMSMFGISFLNRIVKEKSITDPGEILNNLRTNIIRSLKQRGIANESRDGMDMSLISIDRHSGHLKFAGANNPLYLLRNEKIKIIKGDKMPIGIYERMDPFKTRKIDLQQNDICYIFSDGYPDQFGGRKNSKFKYKNFRELLKESSVVTLKEQKDILEEVLDTWQGDNEQVDDILVMGLKV